MRILSAFMGIVCGACTAFQAQENTLRMAATVANIETRQILQVLAEFIDDPDRIPYMVVLGNGQANVQNAVAANWQFNSIANTVVNATTNTRQRTLGFGPPITGQYTDQWVMTAVNDVGDLIRLRCLFSFPARKARGEIDPFMSYDKYSQKRCDRIAGAVAFRPPMEPFFAYRRVGDSMDAILGKLHCSHDDVIVELGTFSGYALVACRRSFHDFELAVLGAAHGTKLKAQFQQPLFLQIPPPPS